VKYFDAKFVRIWLVDREKKYLMLKLIAEKYSMENPPLGKKTCWVRI